MTELEECSGTEDSDADLLKKAEIVESEEQLVGRESKSRYHLLLLDSDLSVLKFMLTFLIVPSLIVAITKCQSQFLSRPFILLYSRLFLNFHTFFILASN